MFLDSDLEEAVAADVRKHLALCEACAKFCEEMASILDFCQSEPADEIVPPNSHALWCRINNVIESEIKQEAPPAPQPKRRLWQISLPQLVSAVLAIGIISSLLTFVAIKNYTEPVADDFTTRSAETQTPFEKVLSKVGLMDSPQEARQRRIQEQKAAIEYWNKRVQARRAQWDAHLRDAFDRNLYVIDETVNEYTRILQQNPDDEISVEMLDSALTDKMDLLREFAEL